MEETERFEAERPRLQRIATGVLGDPTEAEDVVQQAWLRLHATDATIENLPGWLTTVVTRLCLDRLRARTPVPAERTEDASAPGVTSRPAVDPADRVALADTVGVALQVVLDRLTPGERVAFVLHDTFGVRVRHRRRDPGRLPGRGPQARLACPAQGPGRSRRGR